MNKFLLIADLVKEKQSILDKMDDVKKLSRLEAFNDIAKDQANDILAKSTAERTMLLTKLEVEKEFATNMIHRYRNAKLLPMDFGVRVPDVNSSVMFKPNIDSGKSAFWPMFDDNNDPITLADGARPSAEAVLKRKAHIKAYLALLDKEGIPVTHWDDQPGDNKNFTGGCLTLAVGTKYGIQHVNITNKELYSRIIPEFIKPKEEPDLTVDEEEAFKKWMILGNPADRLRWLDIKEKQERQRLLLENAPSKIGLKSRKEPICKNDEYCENGVCKPIPQGISGYTGYVELKKLSSEEIVREQNERLGLTGWEEDDLVPPITSLEHMEIMYRKNKQLK